MKLNSTLTLTILSIFVLSGCGYSKYRPQYTQAQPTNVVPQQQYAPQRAGGNPLSSNYYPKPANAVRAFNPYSPQSGDISRTRYKGAVITQHNKPHMAKSYVSAPDVSSMGGRSHVRARQVISPQARKFLSAINAVRAKGAQCAPPAAPIQYDNNLESAARAHTQDMSYNKFLNHTGSNGSNFIQRVERYGYPASPGHILGEVLTFTKMSISNTNDKQVSFERALENFISSPNHCRIIMNPRMQDVGVGYTQTNTGYYWVMEFGSGR